MLACELWREKRERHSLSICVSQRKEKSSSVESPQAEHIRSFNASLCKSLTLPAGTEGSNAVCVD